MQVSKSSKIINSDELFNLLKSIQKSRQLISYSFNSLPDLGLTSLLEINNDNLIFDEPNPPLIIKQSSINREIKFSLKLNNLPINFKTKLTSCNTNENLKKINTHIPKEIYYPQNRGYYRFRTDLIENASALIYTSSNNSLKSKLIDISLNGLCLQLPYSLAKKYKTNKVISDIFIQLPKQPGFSISAIIRNTRIENNYENIILGLEILPQTEKIDKTIQQFIFHTENAASNMPLSL